MMRVYLVQHGEAASKDVHPDRPLTEKGRRDVEQIAALVRTLALEVSVVLHSGKARAEQTAEMLGAVMNTANGVIQSADLAPNDPIEPIKGALTTAEDDVMIVGHLPFLGKLASALLTGSELADIVAFRQGGVVCLERDEDGIWRVVWMVVPELVG